MYNVELYFRIPNFTERKISSQVTYHVKGRRGERESERRSFTVSYWNTNILIIIIYSNIYSV